MSESNDQRASNAETESVKRRSFSFFVKETLPLTAGASKVLGVVTDTLAPL